MDISWIVEYGPTVLFGGTLTGLVLFAWLHRPVKTACCFCGLIASVALGVISC